MSIPSTYAPIKTQDFTLTPLKVNNEYAITSSLLETTGSGYNLVEGYYTQRITPIGAPQALNDPRNLSDSSYKHIIWKHVDLLYYRGGYTPGSTLEHSNRRYVDKFLNITASYLSIPYMDYGEKIKPGTLRISNVTHDLEIVDDGDGNLYDATLDASLPYVDNANIIGSWGFNDIFRKLKTDNGIIKHSTYQYDSFVFSPYNNPSIIHNVWFEPGQLIGGHPAGMTAVFGKNNISEGYILTPNNNAFNFDNDDEFSISFWIKPEPQPETGSVISKNGVIFKNQYGNLAKTNSEGLTWNKRHTSSSYVDISTDVYPFNITWDYTSGSIGNLNFTRSDGSRKINLSTPISASQWNHVSIVKYTDTGIPTVKMFINGLENTVSGVDPSHNPLNDYAIMFGSHNRSGAQQFSGSLDEVRFVNKAFYSGSTLDDDFYDKLANTDYMFNTSTVGNVFYRSGNVVISPLHPKYKTLLKDSYSVLFKGVHTIYQYEILCRIKKGYFNTTLNPTALRSPKSDIYINDITGSLLKPYATSIGLYNDKGDMVAVAKLGQPIQMRDDVDINILIRMDA